MISARFINRGRRLHLQHGPIDLIIEASGDDVATAYRAAATRFDTVLQELVDELPLLKTRTNREINSASGTVAKRMIHSASQFRDQFTTPMIAVAGSVADEILQAMCKATNLTKAYVNNGGDIALRLAPGQTYTAGIISNPQQADIPATVTVNAADGIRGIATSGRHGRSLSLGIADAVTVMARNASLADAAATLIANAVTLQDNPSIVRVAAQQVDPDSDLKDTAVTVDVGKLSPGEISAALTSGVNYAQRLHSRKLIDAAYLSLQGECRTLCSSSAKLNSTGSVMRAQQNNKQRLVANA